VRTLVDEPRGPGEYATDWDGRDDRGRRVAAGAYLYQLQVGAFTASRKMVLLR